jgi:hypothetical protein
MWGRLLRESSVVFRASGLVGLVMLSVMPIRLPTLWGFWPMMSPTKSGLRTHPPTCNYPVSGLIALIIFRLLLKTKNIKMFK